MKGGHHLKYFLTLVIMQNKKNVKHCMHSYYFYFLSINLKKKHFPSYEKAEPLSRACQSNLW